MVSDCAPVNFVKGSGFDGHVHCEGGCFHGETCLVEVLVDKVLKVCDDLMLRQCIEESN